VGAGFIRRRAKIARKFFADNFLEAPE